MMAAILLLLAILCCSSQHASAFLSPSPITKPLISCAAQRTSTTESDRRSFAEDFLGSISLAFLSSTPCYASGGATAGGAYLLSAKQRYNERVTAGCKTFLNLDGDVDKLNTFFSTADVGGWEDFSAAGYLLSNAFRTSSTKPPDSLPSVKKWKSYAKEIELLKRATAKKDAKKIQSTYKDAEEKLDTYLEAVELPTGMELKQM